MNEAQKKELAYKLLANAARPFRPEVMPTRCKWYGYKTGYVTDLHMARGRFIPVDHRDGYEF